MVTTISGTGYRNRGGYGSDGQQYENHDGDDHEVLVAVIMVAVTLMSLGNIMASSH